MLPRCQILGAITTLSLLAAPAVAHADEIWLLNAAGSAAAPLNDPYSDQFSLGAIGEIGVYHSLNHWAQLGGRFSAGGIDGEDPEAEGDGTFGPQPGNFGIGALSLAARFRPLAHPRDMQRGTGLWLEGAAGPGIVEDSVQPVVSPGAGYIFSLGEIGAGPMARYIRAFETGARFEGEDAELVTLGVELVFFDKAPGREPPTEQFEPGVEPEQPLVPAARLTARDDADRDRDGILEGRDQCPSQPETINGINDHDGCPDDKLEFIGDRLVLDENVFFEYDQASLRPGGKEKLDDIVAAHHKLGFEWQSLKVQGHADSRGPEPYNADLSRRRAEAVKRYLVSQGLQAAMLDVEAYGESEPKVPAADTEAEHQQNRRVEFVIIRKQ